MKKRKHPFAHLDKYIPSRTELEQLTLRGKKDRQTFLWLADSPNGRATIQLVRKILQLPEDGIKAEIDYSFTRLEDLPNFPSNSEVSWERLNFYTLHLLELLQTPSRFYESMKSFIVFNRAVPSAAPALPLVRGVPPKQELMLKLYPDAAFRDIRAVWRGIESMQAQASKKLIKQNPKWKIQIENGMYPTEKLAYVGLRSDTILEDLNNQKFRGELKNAFKKAGKPIKPFRKWNFELDSRFRELNKIPNLSDKDRAARLFNVGNLQDNIQKIRRIRHRSRRK